MRSSIATALLSVMMVAASAAQKTPPAQSVPGSAPQSQPTAKDASDGKKGAVAAGGTFAYKQLTIAVLATTTNSARIRLEEGGAKEEKTVEPKVSLNWHGYHVAITGVHADEVSGGRVDFEVQLVASLPQCIGKPIGKDSPWPCR
jgi:hypothetical protein